ncbi:MAG TPA: LPS export ABC transporter periplasmic protein LptC [Steroidobacteraceae bacterium]|nr:LPS export ABC transporter periplasmic protein LptC [Steroidobacteraceae bacterium]
MSFRIFTILAVVALAVSTWILSTPTHTRKPATAALRARQPGYYLQGAVLTDYDRNGDPSVKIAAARIDQIDGGNEVALHDIRVDYQTPGGQSWLMVGDLAHIEPGGNAIDVSGNVRLTGADREHAGAALIRTDQLTYDVHAALVRTASDVHIDFAGQTLSARGLIANLNERTVSLESRVNGRFLP